MEDLCVPGVAAAPAAYHLRVAVALAVAGNAAESASEAALAWTILSIHDGRLNELAVAELPAPTTNGALTAEWDALQRRTEALALSLQAHFVSEGEHATAAIYEAAATAVRDALAALRDRR